MISPGLLAQRVRQLELRARKAVSHLGSGVYRSTFQGHGIEFHEIREYVPGDDIRAIDWNVTARHGRPFLKRFVEEREQTVYLLVDGSASTRFRAKRDTIEEMAATIAYAAVSNNDKVGLILFGAEVEGFVPPGTGMNHALRIMRDVCAFTPTIAGTDLAKPLQYLDRVSPRRIFGFLISDFLSPDADPQFRISGRRHSLIAIQVTDPAEIHVPSAGLVLVTEPESGARVMLDTGDAGVRARLAADAKARSESWSRNLRAAQIDHFEIAAGEEYFPGFLKFMRRLHRS